jgi:LAS superfamily LD-carboxypeptidase LdcB
MKHLTESQRIALVSFLVFTWVGMFFFWTHIQAYEQKTQRFENIKSHSSTDLTILKLREKFDRCGDFYCLSGAEFIEIYQNKEDVSNVTPQELPITSDPDVDTYIRTFAESLGYQQRGFVSLEELTVFNTLLIRSEVSDAYRSLRNDMSRDNIDLHLVSSFRSFEHQRLLFLSQLGIEDISLIPEGVYDQQLKDVLARSAPPGYSKHHTGYAVDFACGDEYLVFEFADTECYQWMSENNFEGVKQHGFIPSYPEGVKYQGPQPEPWEYVWVGVEMLG